MNDVSLQIDDRTQAQLDRLVAGELPEHERSALLAWLDEDARRWRICALAFLEAQCWEQAAAMAPRSEADLPRGSCNGQPVTIASASVQRAVPTVAGKPLRKSNCAKGLSVLAVAASLAIAFVLGAYSERSGRVAGPAAAPPRERVQQPPAQPEVVKTVPPQADGPLLATVVVRTNLDPRVPMLLQLPVTASGEPLERPPAMSDYVRSQWKRRGFDVIEELRYLPARLPDGREISVPITSVRFEYKGRPVL